MDRKWRKSSYSSAQGNCVEVSTSLPQVAVRDSKDVTGPELAFTRQAWSAFVTGIKSGELGL
jgi:Domain of unknown function (DUF397)